MTSVQFRSSAPSHPLHVLFVGDSSSAGVLFLFSAQCGCVTGRHPRRTHSLSLSSGSTRCHCRYGSSHQAQKIPFLIADRAHYRQCLRYEPKLTSENESSELGEETIVSSERVLYASALLDRTKAKRLALSQLDVDLTRQCIPGWLDVLSPSEIQRDLDLGDIRAA